METRASESIIHQLRREILALQGNVGLPVNKNIRTGLGAIEQVFSGQTFPMGVIHEFVSTASEYAAATNGFIAGLIRCLMQSPGNCLWISTRRTIFPPALKAFGIAPERIIFIDVMREKEALWTIEEALRCKSLSAVVGEVTELGFTESRRLQLAVEESRVTGFIHRYRPRADATTASVTRWKISPLASAPEDGLPGIGCPRWKVQLLKVRNGKPGTWHVEWTDDGFRLVPLFTYTISKPLALKTG